MYYKNVSKSKHHFWNALGNVNCTKVRDFLFRIVFKEDLFLPKKLNYAFRISRTHCRLKLQVCFLHRPPERDIDFAFLKTSPWEFKHNCQSKLDDAYGRLSKALEYYVLYIYI